MAEVKSDRPAHWAGLAPEGSTPTYNLGSVVRVTGLPADTLRAWERRYGLPTPYRTAGGHRVYTQRDVETVKWLMARQREGFSISRAVDQWRRLEAAGVDPLTPTPATSPAPSPGGGTADLREAWVEACLAFEEQRAERVLEEAFARYTAEVACVEVLQRGMADIGDAWQAGRTSVQQEHFASELAVRRLERLIAATPPPLRPGRLLVCCPPREEHSFGPLLLTLLLRRRGWDITYLGANVPLARLEATVRETATSLVVLSAQRLATTTGLLEAALLIRRGGITVGYGGRPFNLVPELRPRVPGRFLGEALERAPLEIENLLRGGYPPTANEYLPPPTALAELARFRQRRAMVEGDALAAAAAENRLSFFAVEANDELGDEVAAALAFQDAELLASSIAWPARHLPVQADAAEARLHLAAYARALESHVGPGARPLAEVLLQLAGIR